MISISQLGGVDLFYEVDGEPSSFRIAPDFNDQLQTWADEWFASAPYETPTRFSSYGAWLPTHGDCDSWHKAGRAFDIGGLRTADATIISCRTDLWDDLEANYRDQLRVGYWKLAASLHRHFSYVLTYLYDEAHANHIHVDNSQSGDAMSEFNSRSRVQVQAVQAIARYVWDLETEITGTWSDARPVADEMLDDLGLSGGLSANDNWQQWLRASVER